MINIIYNFRDSIKLAMDYYCDKSDRYNHKIRFIKNFPELNSLKNKKEIKTFLNKKFKEIEAGINIRDRIDHIKDFFNKNQNYLENNLFKLMDYPNFDIKIKISLLFFCPYEQDGFYLSILSDNYLNDTGYLYLHETSHIIWHKRESEILKNLKIDFKTYFRALHDIKEIFVAVIINQEVFKPVLKNRLDFLKKNRNQNFDKDYGNYYENYFVKENNKIMNIVDYFIKFYNDNINKGFMYVQKEAIKKVLKINHELNNKFEILKQLDEFKNSKLINELRKPIVLYD